MRYAKLKMVAAVVCTVVGLAGTGVMVAVSQEKKADPKAPAGDAKAPPRAEIKEPFETAFPDIKAFGEPGVECPRFTGKVAVPADRTDLLRRLAKARLDSLVIAFNHYQTFIEAGRWDAGTYPAMLQLHRDIAESAADAVGPTDELVRWHQEWVSVAKRLEGWFRQRFRAGSARQDELERIRAERFYAERELLKLKTKLGKP
jgi:hypothetical protein